MPELFINSAKLVKPQTKAQSQLSQKPINNISEIA